MSDDTQTDTTKPAGDPAPNADLAAKIADLESKLTEHATRVSTLAAERDALSTERDALAERAKLVESLTAERDKALGDFTKLVNTNREAALMSKLYTALPHAPKTDVLRTVKALAAEGKVVMATETPDKTASDVLEMLKSEQSALLRTPVGASGATNPQVQASPQVDPLVAAFGPRRR